MSGRPTTSPMAAAYARAAETVQSADRDRYVADLFAPEPFRKHLFALHAFNAEVARVRDVVSDPMLGEIRLQWWRDAILNGAGGGHPVATALNATIAKFKLPKAAFQRLLDARLFDLYDDPMPTLNDLGSPLDWALRDRRPIEGDDHGQHASSSERRRPCPVV